MNIKKMLAIYGGLVIGIGSAAYAAEPKPEPVPPTSLDLRTTVDGSPIDLSTSLPTERGHTRRLKFLQTGVDPYIDGPELSATWGEPLSIGLLRDGHGEIGEG